jgi:hypothetical protein
VKAEPRLAFEFASWKQANLLAWVVLAVNVVDPSMFFCKNQRLGILEIDMQVFRSSMVLGVGDCSSNCATLLIRFGVSGHMCD